MKRKEIDILNELRKNSRKSLTEISCNTQVPMSSVFKIVKSLKKNIIKRYVSLLNFRKLGYNISISLALKSKNKQELQNFLIKCNNVNSFFRIAQDYDFFVEGIFDSMLGFETFLESIGNLIQKKKVYYIIDTIKEEGFVIKNEFS